MKKILSLMAAFAAISVMAANGFAGTPLGFSATTIPVNAQVASSCVEAQHGSFPNPLTIDTQSANDQTFPPSADELVKCSNGTVYMVKVSSANGTAIGQACTAGGVSSMALKSSGTPSDTIAYIFSCAGDTNGAGYFTGGGYNTSRSLGISIKVLAANAQAAFAHADYSDTVTLTLTY
ncbi:MAG: hypothetical protein WAU61_04715 [Smithella sp.]